MRRRKPTVWKICPTCHGEGTSSAYLGAYTADEFNEQFAPEEQDDYISGAYDRPCDRCSGTGKVSRESERNHHDRRADLYQQWLESGRPEGSFSAWSGL